MIERIANLITEFYGNAGRHPEYILLSLDNLILLQSKLNPLQKYTFPTWVSDIRIADHVTSFMGLKVIRVEGKERLEIA